MNKGTFLLGLQQGSAKTVKITEAWVRKEPRYGYQPQLLGIEITTPDRTPATPPTCLSNTANLNNSNAAKTPGSTSSPSTAKPSSPSSRSATTPSGAADSCNAPDFFCLADKQRLCYNNCNMGTNSHGEVCTSEITALWSDFAGQLVCTGDSRRMDEVQDNTVDFFMTSPPYWNLKQYGSGSQLGQDSYQQYLEDLDQVWSECYRCAKDEAVLVVNINSRRVNKRFYPIAVDIASRMKGWQLWDHVIWYIPNALPQPNHYMERLLDNKFESCLVFTKDGSTNYQFHKPRVPQKYEKADPRAHKKNKRGRCVGNVLRIPAYRPPNVKQMGYHVAAYPEELAAFFLECYTDPGDRVLDPFLGSGTTLKVARVMNRSGIGFEINSDYLPLIEHRIQEHWEVPDWRTLDILHSSTMVPGSHAPRKVQFRRNGQPKQVCSLFAD